MKRPHPAPAPAPVSGSVPAEATELIRPYLEGELSAAETMYVENLARQNPAFARQIESRRWLLHKMAGVYGPKRLTEHFQEGAESKLRDTTSQAALGQITPLKLDDAEREPVRSEAGAFSLLSAAPWWGISVALHVLIIILLGLITMTIGQAPGAEGVIVLTTLDRAAALKADVVQETKPSVRDALSSQHEVPPTDPNSTVASNIVVPPDILALAELGDHFETINLDRPDTHSAFGNPEARMFHSVSGNDEPEGGGGMGGTSLLDDLIGVGGSSSPGSGGGWGGGNGTGIGVGNGSGRGSFGSRQGGGRRLMVMRHGGSPKTESAVDKSLEWLARHQEADGRWSVRATGGEGSGNSIDWDPGVTGLATLAFLGAGHSEKVGKYKEVVKRAIAWIVSQQRDDGAIGTDPKWAEHHGGYGYHHAICGMALAEAAGMGRVPETKKAAQKAIEYSCEQYQCGEGSDKLAWRYTPKAKEADISVSGWYVMQLKSAKIAGLGVNPASFEGAMKFLETREADAAHVKKEDDTYDNGRYRYGYLDRIPSFNTTSIGILCKLFTGSKPEEVTGAALWLLRTNPPAWKAELGVGNGGGWPMYFMYYTTLTMFQTGGDLWKQWNEGLKKTLCENQRKDGDFDGSWDPLSTWEKRAGRAYTTALGAMCLEVYYRYLPLYRE